MPEPARPAQKVRWRNPQLAHAWGWQDLFGPGPFEVVRRVDKSPHGLRAGLLLRTAMGEWEISEVWLALADEPGNEASPAGDPPSTGSESRS
jgi:hypothetical protein